MVDMQRRKFITRSAQFGLGLGLIGLSACGNDSATTAENSTTDTLPAPPKVDVEPWFRISLAQWSLNKALFTKEMDNLDFAATARNQFGISGIEYVNQFFKDKAEDMAYLGQMKQRAMDNDVTSVLIMCDGEGQLGDMDKKARVKAVENHYKWVNAAKVLGCHSIRVNAATQGSFEDGIPAATDGLRLLSEYAAQENINVIVENHGGWSSNGTWLTKVIAGTEMKNCGTLPDFGNFCIERNETGCINEYDRYQGISELMPYAKAVSAKSHDFNAEGEEINTAYGKVLETVKNNGYRGWIGVEYEGTQLSAAEGIIKTRDLLLKYGGKL